MNVIPKTTGQPLRTCDQLGICQGRTIPCLNCTRPDAPQWPPADGDTETASSFELICAGGLVLLIGLVVCVVVFVLSHWLV